MASQQAVPARWLLDAPCPWGTLLAVFSMRSLILPELLLIAGGQMIGGEK